jgi:hypothetical protein
MNKRGYILTTTVVFVLILTTISILVMGLVMSGVEMQHRNEKEIKAHLNLENAGYDCLNQYKTINRTSGDFTPFPGRTGYSYLFSSDTFLIIRDSDNYQLEITFSIDSNFIYQIQGWVISKNG